MTFSYRTTKNGRVFIAWEGRQVVTLTGNKAAKFLSQVADPEAERQLVMARFTGKFKRGNERG